MYIANQKISFKKISYKKISFKKISFKKISFKDISFEKIISLNKYVKTPKQLEHKISQNIPYNPLKKELAHLCCDAMMRDATLG